MPYLERDGIRFHYLDMGRGTPVVIQHGLGGDTSQPAALFMEHLDFRLLTLDCRGHGNTTPKKCMGRCSFSQFADDLLAWLDHLGLKKPIVGGISMGAGVAINYALRNPNRLSGLILCRPAWLNKSRPDNLRVFPKISKLLRSHGADEGAKRFRRSRSYLSAMETSPATATSYLRQFSRPQSASAAMVLFDLPHDAPFKSSLQLQDIAVPTLILGERGDPVHPYEFAVSLVAGIPEAKLAEVTSKSMSLIQHQKDVCSQISAFVEKLNRDKANSNIMLEKLTRGARK